MILDMLKTQDAMSEWKGKDFDEVVERACQESSFLEALAWIAGWERKRSILNARNSVTWEPDGMGMLAIFERIEAEWVGRSKEPYHPPKLDGAVEAEYEHHG